jgi:hypothetical protein
VNFGVKLHDLSDNEEENYPGYDTAQGGGGGGGGGGGLIKTGFNRQTQQL